MRDSHLKPVWAERRVVDCAARPTTTAVHEHVALAYFTDGAATIEQRGRFEVAAGDVLLVPAGEPHRWIRSSQHASWGVGFCAPCFAPSELADLLDPFERARAGSSAVIRIPADRQAHLAALCAELARETSAAAGDAADDPRRVYPALAQRSLLALVLLEVARAATATPASDARPGVVGSALRYIERHCLRPISLADVAAAVDRSPSHVTTALKRATGKTAVDWIIAGRLAEARRRLLHTDERVDRISERVGYADATHFIRLFRRSHGVTPAAWRAARRRP
jgi:AraC family transcriptional regulator, transcriptional activator of pobA